MYHRYATAYLPVSLHLSHNLTSTHRAHTALLSDEISVTCLATSFCRSSAVPAFTSSETTSVLPHLAASISGDHLYCMMTDMCSETLNCFIIFLNYLQYSVKEHVHVHTIRTSSTMGYLSLSLDTPKPHLHLHTQLTSNSNACQV